MKRAEEEYAWVPRRRPPNIPMAITFAVIIAGGAIFALRPSKEQLTPDQTPTLPQLPLGQILRLLKEKC